MKEFKTVEGISVSNLMGIKEGYRVEPYGDNRWDNRWDFFINVSAENIDIVFRKLSAAVRTPGFLLLELGANAKIEETLRNSIFDPLHLDIFYIDGLDMPSFLEIYGEYAELLINDGEINYGFGSHNGLDEVFVAPYKIIKIMTDEPDKYKAVLREMGFQENATLKTVWQNFTLDQPGKRRAISRNGIDIYDMVERLKEKGLYLAEQREN
jgi:hypothetical protein